MGNLAIIGILYQRGMEKKNGAYDHLLIKK